MQKINQSRPRSQATRRSPYYFISSELLQSMESSLDDDDIAGPEFRRCRNELRAMITPEAA